MAKAHKQQHANRKMARVLVLVAVGMFGFGFALWPLYDIFCDITGFGGRGVQEVSATGLQQQQSQRQITVRFDATVNSGLNWEFKPTQNTKTVNLGNLSHASYTTYNPGEKAVIGHAIYNVAPPEASLYFVKTECFCFTEQLLKSGETREMPVNFYISPDLPENIKTITLSYTFFRDEKASIAMNHESSITTKTTNDT